MVWSGGRRQLWMLMMPHEPRNFSRGLLFRTWGDKSEVQKSHWGCLAGGGHLAPMGSFSRSWTPSLSIRRTVKEGRFMMNRLFSCRGEGERVEERKRRKSGGKEEEKEWRKGRGYRGRKGKQLSVSS